MSSSAKIVNLSFDAGPEYEPIKDTVDVSREEAFSLIFHLLGHRHLKPSSEHQSLDMIDDSKRCVQFTA
jgi:hypothetical protein